MIETIVKINNNLIEKIIEQFKVKTNFIKNGVLYYSSNLNAIELSKVINRPVNIIISYFWKQGQEVTQNQNLSLKLIQQYCDTLNLKVEQKEIIDFNGLINNYLKENIVFNDSWKPRTTVISVMGHIDHGKTTFIDTICKTKIQTQEFGGITQKITTVPLVHKDNDLLLLDTPGHQNFIKLRHRIIFLTDVVILIVDAKDGVMEQTEEIIDHLHQYSLPVLIFLNHKKERETNNEKNITRIYTQLQNKGLTPLEWGGDVLIISGNAKISSSVEQVLDNIPVLVQPKADFNGITFALIIDSFLNTRTNSIINKVLIKNGTLKVKDLFFVNGQIGQINQMQDYNGESIQQASPGDLIYLNNSKFKAELGDFLIILDKEQYKELSTVINPLLSNNKKVIPGIVKKEQNNVNLFLIADSQNSLQSIIELIKRYEKKNIVLTIVYSTIGQLTYSELELARITSSIIISFSLPLNSFITKYIKENNLIHFETNIIYDLEEIMSNIIDQYQFYDKVSVEKVIGELNVKICFKFSKGNIAGCKVNKGIINRNSLVHIYRDNIKIHTGKVKNLQVDNRDAKEVAAGYECGITLEKFNDFREGDKLIAFNLITNIN